MKTIRSIAAGVLVLAISGCAHHRTDDPGILLSQHHPDSEDAAAANKRAEDECERAGYRDATFVRAGRSVRVYRCHN